MNRLIVWVALMLATQASARDIKIQGEKKIPQNSFAELWVEAAGPNVSWKVYPAPVKMVKRDGFLYFSGKPGIEYLVTFTAIDFDKKTFDEGQDIVVFAGSDPGPDPGPGPGPPPDDPLVVKLRAALAQEDVLEQALFQKLKDAYKTIASNNYTVTTWSTFFNEMQKEFLARGVSQKLLKVQVAAAEEIKKYLPVKDGPLDDEGKALAKQVFTKISQALEKVK